MSNPLENNAEIDRLRINSRTKHLILKDYLPAWFSILGTWHKTLNYFDCFAGSGRYVWKDEKVDGSPVISINACINLLQSNSTRKPEKINLLFVDDDEQQLEKLDKEIKLISGIPKALNIEIKKYDSKTLIEEKLSQEKDLEPSFFFIDPYGHPFSLSLMKSILSRPRTEIMVNIMYYRIIMDMRNPGRTEHCDRLFYPEKCKDIQKDITNIRGSFSSTKMLDYLHQRLGAQYHIPFRVHYGPDENVTSGRLKYLLVHFSNQFTAFNLMLNIMWKNSDDGNPLTVREGRPPLFPLKDISELESHIIKVYLHTGQKITFENFLSINWQQYFLEKHYRVVLKKLEQKGMITIQRVESKATGLKGRDLLIFT
jgi:three-Cys-motif partner protein